MGRNNEIDFVFKNVLLPRLNPNLQHIHAKLRFFNNGMVIHGPSGSGKKFFAEALYQVFRRVDSDLKIMRVRDTKALDEIDEQARDN